MSKKNYSTYGKTNLEFSAKEKRAAAARRASASRKKETQDDNPRAKAPKIRFAYKYKDYRGTRGESTGFATKEAARKSAYKFLYTEFGGRKYDANVVKNDEGKWESEYYPGTFFNTEKEAKDFDKNVVLNELPDRISNSGRELKTWIYAYDANNLYFWDEFEFPVSKEDEKTEDEIAAVIDRTERIR